MEVEVPEKVLDIPEVLMQVMVPSGNKFSSLDDFLLKLL